MAPSLGACRESSRLLGRLNPPPRPRRVRRLRSHAGRWRQRANLGPGELMGKTFAGANKCNPKNHERPFVIEWDATDMSSFEARAATDVVFVKYEGCDLKVLDGCVERLGPRRRSARTSRRSGRAARSRRSTSERGRALREAPARRRDARRPRQGRREVPHGVLRQRHAHRDARPRSTAASSRRIPAATGATHFVYGYKLGAFALGARVELKGEVGGQRVGLRRRRQARSSATTPRRRAASSRAAAPRARKEVGRPARSRSVSRCARSTTARTPTRPPQRARDRQLTNLAGKVDQKMKMNDVGEASLSGRDGSVQRP